MFILIGLLVGILVGTITYAIAVPAKDEEGKRSKKKVFMAYLIAVVLGTVAIGLVYSLLGDLLWTKYGF